MPRLKSKNPISTPRVFLFLLIFVVSSNCRAQIKEVRAPEDAITPKEYGDITSIQKTIARKGAIIDLVLIGDTITEFWSKTGKESFAEFEAWNPLNLGFGGQSTEHVLWRLQNGVLEGYEAKVVMIMIGTNNIGHFAGEQPEWVAAGIKKIVETIKEKQPRAKILLLAIFPRGGTVDDKNNRRIMDTNELLPVLADGKTVFFMDIGARFLDESGIVNPELMPNQFLPNAAGYKVWMEAVKPKLSELMQQEAP